jgi:hypothetical protein
MQNGHGARRCASPALGDMEPRRGDRVVGEARVGLAGTGRRKRSSAQCATAGSLRSRNYDPVGGAQSLTWYKGAQIVPAWNICRAFASTDEACPVTRVSAS